MSSVAVKHCAWRAVQGVLDDHRPGCMAFDTETTSLRGSVIQAALVELNAHGEEECVMSGIIPPPRGEELDPRAVEVHGITSECILTEGQPAVPFLRGIVSRIQRACAEGRIVVAHNAAFDLARFNATLLAHGIDDEFLLPDQIFCTMQKSKRHCILTNVNGNPRCPKNAELFSLLHGVSPGERFEGSLHDATVDARITGHSFLEGRRRGWW